MSQIASTYVVPGPFLTLTHGDPAPTNTHVSARGALRLLDFEYGAYRHALYDVTAWDVLCPLPQHLVTLVRDVHHTSLAHRLPATRDDTRYREGWALMAAYRALATLTWIPTQVLVQDRPWVETWSSRRAVLATLSRLRDNAAFMPALAPLATAAGDLFGALAARWPEAAGDGSDAALLPRWPALA